MRSILFMICGIGLSGCSQNPHAGIRYIVTQSASIMAVREGEHQATRVFFSRGSLFIVERVEEINQPPQDVLTAMND